MTIDTAVVITALSMLMPCAFTRAQDAPTTSQPTAAELQRLQGSWEGVLVGQESAGKIAITITGNSLYFQGLSTNEWYDTTFTLPSGTDPQQLKATIKACPRPDDVGTVVFAIFKIEDETLTLVGIEGSAQDPPKAFDDDKTLFKIDGLGPLDEPKTSERKGTFRYALKKVQPQKKTIEPPKSKGTGNASPRAAPK